MQLMRVLTLLAALVSVDGWVGGLCSLAKRKPSFCRIVSLSASKKGSPLLGDDDLFADYEEEFEDRRPKKLEQLTNKVQSVLLASTLDIQVPGPGAAREGQYFALQQQEPQRQKRALDINLDLLNYRAKKSRRSGRDAEARKLWRLAIEIDDRDGRAWIALSKDAEKSRRDPQLAATLLSQSLRLNPKSAYVRQAYGVLLERQGLWRRALEEYDKGLRSQPTHAASLVAKARLVVRHRLEDGTVIARDCYERALVTEPKNAFALVNWAEMEGKQNDAVKARELFGRAARANPRNCATFVSWALFEERKATLELQEQKKKQEVALFGQGEVLERIRKLFAMATAAHPSNTRALTAWAGVELRCGNATGATALLEKAARIPCRLGGCRDAAVLAHLGDVYWKKKGKKDHARARDAFRRAVSLDATLPRTYRSWALMEQELGEVSRAREILQQGVWGCSSGIPDRAALAELWLASGQLELAEATAAATSKDTFERNRAAGYADASRRAFRSTLDYASSLPKEGGKSIATQAALAWASLELSNNDSGRARALLEDSVANTPDEPRLWRALLDLELSKTGFHSRPATTLRQRARAALTGDHYFLNDPALKTTPPYKP